MVYFKATLNLFVKASLWQVKKQVIGEKHAVSVMQLFSVALHIDHKMAVLSNMCFS